MPLLDEHPELVRLVKMSLLKSLYVLHPDTISSIKLDSLYFPYIKSLTLNSFFARFISFSIT